MQQDYHHLQGQSTGKLVMPHCLFGKVNKKLNSLGDVVISTQPSNLERQNRELLLWSWEAILQTETTQSRDAFQIPDDNN